MDGDPQASQERRSSALFVYFSALAQNSIPGFSETDKKEGAAEDVYAEERWRMKMFVFTGWRWTLELEYQVPLPTPWLSA